VQQELMAALPVRKLWGVGPVAEEKLKRLGIETIGALARLPEPEVVSVLGATVGPSLQRLARGIDDRPVAERADAKQVSAETTYAQDIVTMVDLRRAVDASAAAAFRRLERDGRAARTVVLKLRKSDMSILTRSLTLPYATTDARVLTATAQRQVLDPLEIGPVRLVGVGFGGLSAVSQGSLFPELDQAVPDVGSDDTEQDSGFDVLSGPTPGWRPGLDVAHPQYGHGWVQGAGHGVVTVRFETRSTGPGPSRTFDETDCDLTVADPADSLR